MGETFDISICMQVLDLVHESDEDAIFLDDNIRNQEISNGLPAVERKK